jgi:hypothetical protein
MGGHSTVITSLIRFKYLNQSQDIVYTTAPIAAWSGVELCSGITCTSIVTLKPLAEKWIPWLVGKTRTQQKSYATNDLESSNQSRPTKSDLSTIDSRAEPRHDVYGVEDVDDENLPHYSKQSWGSDHSEEGIMRRADGSRPDNSHKESQ